MEFLIMQKLVLASALGMFIGLERHLKKKSAGMRTHSLVALGTCIFTVIGVNILGNGSAEMPARIIPGIITGIGFLGAGLIFQGKEHGGGLTTAIEIWTLAGIGILVGLGSYLIAVLATLLVLIILAPLRWIEEKIGS
ncbi:MAG: MgtC/SapB family protein [Parcubacteria group bacterium]|nr:MgtC/SapB family protein [Parcubacteria group bacterium]MBI4217335.1 MgtC/SapB family protein [Parcubacteria group bacterium]